MKRVSVVTPVYNVEPAYLEAAVRSVFSQTFRNVEMVIVDDGSTREDTIRCLEKLRENPSIRILRQNNMGPSAARNAAVRAATGDYVLPLDADDLIEASYVEEACGMLERNPRLGIVYCQADYIGTQTGPWNLPAYSFPEFLLGNCIFCTALFRKSDWLKVGGYKREMTIGWEDYEFFISLVERGLEVYQIPKVLFHYRKHGQSRSTYADTEEGMARMWGQIRRLHRCLFFRNFRFLRKHKADIYVTWKRLPLSEKFRELARLDSHNSVEK